MTPGLRIAEAETPEDLEAVRRLCWDYRAFLLTLPAPDRDVVLLNYPEQAYARTMDSLAADFGPPGGSIKLARIDDAPVGCGMARTFAPGTAEIKRLFVRPEARGSGAGRALMSALIDTCRANGFRRILLDTGRALETATRLYLALGFRRRGPYSVLPPEVTARMFFFEMDL